MTARVQPGSACLGCAVGVHKGRVLCVSCDRRVYQQFKAANRGLHPFEWQRRINALFGNREKLRAAARAALAGAV